MEIRRKFALRPGTVANHRTHLKNFVRFCIFYNLRDFPASGNTLSLFAEFLCRTYQAPNSVLNALSSVRFFHQFLNYESSGFFDFKFSLTKQALPRSVRYAPSPALPMTLKLLQNICAISLNRGAQGVAFAALCIIGFHTLARLSSLVPSSVDGCDLTRTVQISDVAVTNYGLDLTIKWSKSQQLLQERLVIPLIKRVDHDNICPVVAVSRLLISLPSNITADSPLFSWPTTRGTVSSIKFFTIPSARSFLKCILTNLGLDAQKYSFHSFRRGGCQLGYIKGATMQELKFLGGWSSDAICRYLPVHQATFNAASALTR